MDYTKEDLKVFKHRDIKPEQIDRQLANFEKGFDYVDLSEPATIGNGIIRIDIYMDLRTKTSQRFIDCVIHDLIYQMVKPSLRCASDIHARTFSDCLQPLQHLNLTLVIALCALFHFFCHMFYPSCQRSCIPLTLPETGVCVFQTAQ